MTIRKILGYMICSLPAVVVLVAAAIAHGVMFALSLVALVGFAIGCGFLGARLIDD